MYVILQALLYGKRSLQRIAVGAQKQQIEIPLDVVADIPGKAPARSCGMECEQ